MESTARHMPSARDELFLAFGRISQWGTFFYLDCRPTDETAHSGDDCKLGTKTNAASRHLYRRRSILTASKTGEKWQRESKIAPGGVVACGLWSAQDYNV